MITQYDISRNDCRLPVIRINKTKAGIQLTVQPRSYLSKTITTPDIGVTLQPLNIFIHG